MNWLKFKSLSLSYSYSYSYSLSLSNHQVLRNIVQRSLAEADRLQMNSIAFPVIGTGKFDFPHATASNIMLREAIQFCETNQSSSIKDVRFVVFNQDQPLITAFKQEMAAMQANYGAGVRPVIAHGGSFCSNWGKKSQRSCYTRRHHSGRDRRYCEHQQPRHEHAKRWCPE